MEFEYNYGNSHTRLDAHGSLLTNGRKESHPREETRLAAVARSGAIPLMVARIACTMVERIEVGKWFLLIEGASKGFWSSNASLAGDGKQHFNRVRLEIVARKS
jgi:hypothetical protein